MNHHKKRKVDKDCCKREFDDKIELGTLNSLLGLEGINVEQFKQSLKRLIGGTSATEDAILEGWNLHVEGVTKRIVEIFEEMRKADEELFHKLLLTEKNSFIDSAKVAIGELNAYPACLIYAGWERCKKDIRRSIVDTLKDLAKNNDDVDKFDSGPGIRTIQACLRDQEIPAYYISGDSAVDFRHEGVSGKKPKVIYLEDFSNETISKLVHVFYSSSGSGKTVELAGSAVTRKCHLALVVTSRDGDYEKNGGDDMETSITDEDMETVDQEENRRKRRESRSLGDLGYAIAGVIGGNEAAFESLLKAATEENKLKLVVAIDEASACPELVRSIIHNREKFASTVVEMFDDEFKKCAKKIEVLFSVAGTGASASTVGSKIENFKNLKPSFVQRHAELRNKLLSNLALPKMLVLGGGGEGQDLSESIETCLPVVSVMMENGRMASIACRALAEQDRFVPIVESTLVERIAIKFMKSNGLQNLVDDPVRRHHVAAAALAVHLFQARSQEKFPANTNEYEKVAHKMDFALPLAKVVQNDNVSVERIVSKYGLVEPNYNTNEQKWGANEEITKPFVMSSSQQLIAIFMLDVRLENMLEASPYGFETLSTHLVKCAVAASLAVEKEKRPYLQEVLQKIGFQVDPLNTSATIKKRWADLNHCKAIGSKWKDTGKKCCEVFRSTYQMKSELMKTKLDDDIETDYLIIDKLVFEALENLGPDPEGYSSPVSCVNFGNSPFADGFITFHIIKEICSNSDAASGFQTNQKNHMNDSPEDGNICKFSIMNQSKDYHSSSLNTKKLQKHAELGDDKLLHNFLGVSRLLCVSSSQNVLIPSRKCKCPRDFLPFCANQSAILERLLATLQHQRALRHRLKTHAFCCNEDGKQVEDWNLVE